MPTYIWVNDVAQVMACYLTTPSQYLNQCWLLYNGAMWHSPESTPSAQASVLHNEFENDTFKITSIRPRANELHDDVIKWKHFPRNWPFVRGIHRSPVNSPHKGQWRGALMFSLIYVWIKGWVNNREAGDLRRYLVHYDVTVMNQTQDEYLDMLISIHWRIQIYASMLQSFLYA